MLSCLLSMSGLLYKRHLKYSLGSSEQLSLQPVHQCLHAYMMATAQCFCHLALHGAQLLTPEGDTGGFTSFFTLGSCFINLQCFSIGTHIGGWLSRATVALLQGQGVGFAGHIAVPARLMQSPFGTLSDSYQLTYSPTGLWVSRSFK